MEIWSLAWDTESGTGASVHLTERECFEELIRDYVDLEKQDEAKKELDLDDTVDDGTEHDFWEWFDDNAREPMDTFNIESHKIEAPAPPVTIFTDRELATVLHALRVLQEVRGNEFLGGCWHHEKQRVEQGQMLTSCDHFEESKPLSNQEIDDLCDRLGLAPEQPQEKVL